MRNKLAAVFNALHNVQTKGESTLILADCIRELLSIIQEMDKNSEKEESNG